MNHAGRVERLERRAAETAPPAFERIAADIGGGYRVDVDVPAGSLARLEKIYGGTCDEPTEQG